MPNDLSSVAREAAEQSGHYPDTMLGNRQLQRAYVRGFTECASRLPNERDIEIAILGRTATQAAKAVYALIGERLKQ